MATVFGVWAIFVALMVSRLFLDPDSMGRTAETGHTAILGRALFYFGWALLTPGVFWMSQHLGTGGRLRPWQRIGLHVVAGLVVAVGMDAYGDLVREYLVPYGRSTVATPGAALRGSLEDVLTLGFTYELTVYLAILAVGFARAYYRRLQQRRMQAAELRAQLTEARLQALRMQINPHFLFNTLNAVSGLVERDPKGVRTMVARLSALLRHTLAQDGCQEVTMDEELGVLDDYLAIMKVRFEDRLRVEKDIEPAAYQALVPDLIMQPLVENAIKYGISHRETPGRIRITAARQGPYLRLSVQDDGTDVAGDGMPDVSSDGIGLRNVHERLQQLYGSNHRVSLRPAPGGGLVAELWIPFHTDPDANRVRIPEDAPAVVPEPTPAPRT